MVILNAIQAWSPGFNIAIKWLDAKDENSDIILTGWWVLIKVVDGLRFPCAFQIWIWMNCAIDVSWNWLLSFVVDEKQWGK